MIHFIGDWRSLFLRITAPARDVSFGLSTCTRGPEAADRFLRLAEQNPRFCRCFDKNTMANARFLELR